MEVQEFQDPEKVSKMWVKNMNDIVNKMNNTNSSIIDMMPKDLVKLDVVELDKSEASPEKQVLPEYNLYKYLDQLRGQRRDQNRQVTDFV